jgi:CO/xanthine dehydrogenase FAD-binding subunit
MALALEFEYFKPKNLDGAIRLKAEYGKRGRFLAGGTDLVNNLDDEVISPEAVIDLKGIRELKELRFRNGRLWLGTLVTFSELLESPVVKRRFPLIWEAASVVASVSIRNRATAGGNVCSGVPSMDIGPALLVYEATAVIRGSRGKRNVPISEVLAGPKKTSLEEDEILVGFSLPLPAKKHGASYVKLMRYRGEDLAQAGVAVLALPGNRYRVAFGAVGPVPARAAGIEKLLRGKKLTAERIARAKKLVKSEVAPITDIRATKEYRLHLCEVMLERALRAAGERLNGKGPKLGTGLI